MPVIPRPYRALTYTMSVNGSVVGGFTAATGLEAGAGSVVLKRGHVNAGDFYAWLKASRYGVAPRRTIAITLFDATRHRTTAFVLRNARPSKWTGPMLAAKGGGDVAMEELVLTYEGIESE